MVSETKVNDMVQCLLIDRDPEERSRISALLTGMGLDFAEFSLAEEGIAYCNDNKPDVVVMQAYGDTVEARDFVRRVQRNGRQKKPVVIFYADRPDVGTIGNSIMDGAADFLVMPFDRELLSFKLRQAGVIPRS
jgi:two-component system, chemotaxis family, chemotaxis protein CheY